MPLILEDLINPHRPIADHYHLLRTGFVPRIYVIRTTTPVAYRFAKTAAPPRRAPRPTAAVWMGAGLFELVADELADERTLEAEDSLVDTLEATGPVAVEKSDAMLEIPDPTPEVAWSMPEPMSDTAEVAPPRMLETTLPGLGRVSVAP
jgi:hypothetical protein